MLKTHFDYEDNQPHVNALLRQAERDRLVTQISPSRQKSILVRFGQFLMSTFGRWANLFSKRLKFPVSDQSMLLDTSPETEVSVQQM